MNGIEQGDAGEETRPEAPNPDDDLQSKQLDGLLIGNFPNRIARINSPQKVLIDRTTKARKIRLAARTFVSMPISDENEMYRGKGTG